MTLWVIRCFFLALCALSGFAISHVRPELISSHTAGVFIGFGLGGLLIAIDEMIKGFSLRAFSAATVGMGLGALVAWFVDASQLFKFVDEDTQWLIRLGMFLGFGYIGMILAMRSNKEDFYLIIPFVRFAPQAKAENLLLLDTSAIVDGRAAELIEAGFLEGVVVVPQFVLRELQQLADSADPTRRGRGRRGLDLLSRMQRNSRLEVKIHQANVPDEGDVDAKLIRLARGLGAKVFTTDYNLGKVAELQSVPYVNLQELATRLRTLPLPGDVVTLRIVREGRDKGQGVGYLADGTMVIVNQAQLLVGKEIPVQIMNTVQTGAGVIIFADLKLAQNSPPPA
jgi:uncharacterized protein YacL